MRPEPPASPAPAAVDRQRQRVYDAEQRVCDQLDFAARGAGSVTLYGSTLTLAADTRFGSLATAQRWIDHTRLQPWFAARWPAAAAAPVTLRQRRGQRRAHYEPGGVVAVPVPDNATGWAMRELVLLHELAHHVLACDLAAGTRHPVSPAHGGAFTGVMLELVAGALGPETRLVLSAAYHDSGVAVAPAAAVAAAADAGHAARGEAARQ